MRYYKKLLAKNIEKSWLLAICTLPFLYVFILWLSPLVFIPVPWPDDSAFYLVAHDLFQWPPRWIVSAQAPFESSYWEFNFNTMPLFPILIGLGRYFGIDGTFGIKFWPLLFLAATFSTFNYILWKLFEPYFSQLNSKKNPKKAFQRYFIVLAVINLLLFSPALRWASILVRPESFVGWMGSLLVAVLLFENQFTEKKLLQVISIILALSAYAHFNAIHLVAIPLIAFINQPKRLFKIAGWTILYLSPWIFTVLAKFNLFLHQMTTQWQRLAIPNPWLSQAYRSIYQDMGSPIGWPEILYFTSPILFLVIIASFLTLVFYVVLQLKQNCPSSLKAIAPSSAWVISATWLWHTKPEVWFIYYLHLSSLWWLTLSLAFLLKISFQPKVKNSPQRISHFSSLSIEKCRTWSISILTLFTFFSGSIFVIVFIQQIINLSQSQSWKKSTYFDFVNCIDAKLIEKEAELGFPKPFLVWDPTFPDILVELSKRHPDWQLSRTCDFYAHWDKAVEHGRKVHALVVPETISFDERNIEGPLENFPHVKSVWMNWKDYFLIRLQQDKNWHPDRYVCQRGRWQAFLHFPTETLSTKQN